MTLVYSKLQFWTKYIGIFFLKEKKSQYGYPPIPNISPFKLPQLKILVPNSC